MTLIKSGLLDRTPMEQNIKLLKAAGPIVKISPAVAIYSGLIARDNYRIG